LDDFVNLQECSFLAVGFEGVDHDVANELYFFFWGSFFAEVIGGQFIEREEEIAEAVGDKPVDFLVSSYKKKCKGLLCMLQISLLASLKKPQVISLAEVK